MALFLTGLIAVFMVSGVVALRRDHHTRTAANRPVTPATFRRLEAAGLIPPADTDR